MMYNEMTSGKAGAMSLIHAKVSTILLTYSTNVNMEKKSNKVLVLLWKRILTLQDPYRESIDHTLRTSALGFQDVVINKTTKLLPGGISSSVGKQSTNRKVNKVISELVNSMTRIKEGNVIANIWGWRRGCFWEGPSEAVTFERIAQGWKGPTITRLGQEVSGKMIQQGPKPWGRKILVLERYRKEGSQVWKMAVFFMTLKIPLLLSWKMTTVYILTHLILATILLLPLVWGWENWSIQRLGKLVSQLKQQGSLATEQM